MCYLIACKMAEKEQLPIVCRYLEGSRYAWRMAEFALPETDPIEKICIGGIHVTLRKILMRGGLTEQEAENIAKALKKERELDKRLSYEETQKLKPLLASCTELRQRIRKHAEAAYDATVRYFAQEGLYVPEPFGIVDSGWTGSLQQTLSGLLKSGRKCFLKDSATAVEVQGFYFGLYELPAGVNPKNYHTYYFSPYQDIAKKVRFSNCLFEAICSAQEGMTLGYKEENGSITAVYETARNPNAKCIAKNEMLLEKILNLPDVIERFSLSKQEVRKRLERLMSSPTRQEAMYFGGYLFSDDVFSSSLQTVAARLSQSEIRNLHYIQRFLIMKGFIKTDFKDSAWPEGSVALAGDKTAWHLFQIRMYKRLVYIRKKLRSKKKSL